MISRLFAIPNFGVLSILKIQPSSPHITVQLKQARQVKHIHPAVAAVFDVPWLTYTADVKFGGAASVGAFVTISALPFHHAAT